MRYAGPSSGFGRATADKWRSGEHIPEDFARIRCWRAPISGAITYALALMFGASYGAVMPLYAILVREYFGARIMGTMFGAVNAASTVGMTLGPWAGGRLYDRYGNYFRLYIGSFGIGLGAVAIALTFRPPQRFSVTSPGVMVGA